MRDASGTLSDKEDNIMDKNKAINDNELNEVSGGLIFDARPVAGADPNNPWEVIDNKTGRVLDRCPTKEAAVYTAQSKYGFNPYNTMDIDWNSLQALRNNPIA